MKITVTTAPQPSSVTPKPGHLYRHRDGGIYLAAKVRGLGTPLVYLGGFSTGSEIGEFYAGLDGWREMAHRFTDLGPAQVTIE
jgi:hypothetical protein